MSKQVKIDDVIELMLEKLNNGGKVTFTPRGTSMLPMLRDGEDVVILEKPKGRLNLFDVAFYKRDNGQYVLHRVYNFETGGCYVMCGDNQFALEHGIRNDQIIAVMTAFFRKGKSYTVQSLKYRFYVNLWVTTRLPRRAFGFGTRKIKRLFNKRNITDYENKN